LADIPVPRIMQNKMAKALGLDPASVPSKMMDKITIAYICNASGQDINAVFGVHPHGWWRGGTVSYNPATKTNLVQDLVTSSGLTATVAGDLLLYTVTAGKTLYISSFYCMIKASNNSMQIKDAITDTGTVKISFNTGEAASLNPRWGGNFSFPTPMKFETGVMFTSDNAAGTDTVDWTFTGWEE